MTDVACAGLNGMRMGERVLTVRRATEVDYGTANSMRSLQAPTFRFSPAFKLALFHAFSFLVFYQLSPSACPF